MSNGWNAEKLVRNERDDRRPRPRPSTFPTPRSTQIRQALLTQGRAQSIARATSTSRGTMEDPRYARTICVALSTATRQSPTNPWTSRLARKSHRQEPQLASFHQFPFSPPPHSRLQALASRRACSCLGTCHQVQKDCCRVLINPGIQKSPQAHGFPR